LKSGSKLNAEKVKHIKQYVEYAEKCEYASKIKKITDLYVLKLKLLLHFFTIEEAF
jgi:hypothetical protein